jgi:hypothetical protein
LWEQVRDTAVVPKSAARELKVLSSCIRKAPDREASMITVRVAAMIGLAMAASWPAAADCLGTTVRDQKRRVAFVFEGTVTALTVVEGPEAAVVIDTHRVWKGRVPTVVSVHFVPTSEGPSFRVGDRYVVFAVPETEAWRSVAGLPAGSHDGTMWVNSCSGPSPVSPELIKQLGRARKPSTAARTTQRQDRARSK